MSDDTLTKPPSIFRRIAEFFQKPSPAKRLVIYLLIALFVIGLILFLIDRGWNWWSESGTRKKKAEIANTIGTIANIDAEQAELDRQKAELRGQLKRDVEDLQREVYGREDAKGETNKALANYNAALANRASNTTADDLLKAIERLEDRP